MTRDNTLRPALTLLDKFGFPIRPTAPVTLAPVTPDTTPAPDTAPAPDTGPLPVLAPAPVKVGKLQPHDRLVWHGAAYQQRGNSARYNAWMGQAGTFTVEQATGAGVPAHHLAYVLKMGWAARA